jgi:large subunit ribosomal protein L17
MRHGKKINHLGRTSAHRDAMLSNMSASLIMHKRIKTTLAKAKELRVYVEPLITRSKVDSTHSRRVVFSYLQSKEAVTELFREISTKVAQRPGGYTRILKLGTRAGDNADMCFIELVDYNENLLAEKTDKKAKATTRRGRSVKKTTEDTATTIEAAPKKKTTKKVTEVKAEETVVDKVEEVAENTTTETKEEATTETEETKE